MLAISLEIPQKYRNKAQYVFNSFSQIWGLPIRFCNHDESNIHIRYAATTPAQNSAGNTIVVPLDEDLYEKETICSLTQKEGYDMWSKNSNSRDVDLVASSYRLLTLQDESQVPRRARDSMGAFMVADLPPHRRIATDIPLVDSHAQQLLGRILRSYPEMAARIVPKWPNGASYAVSLTHDTDAVNVGAPKEIIKNAANFFLKRDATYFTLLTRGVKTLLNARENPLFGFPSWKAYESNFGIRSCFYLYLDTPGTKVHLHDCKSTVMDKGVDWEQLLHMAHNGWEFGFHAPINAKKYPSSFVHGRRVLEQKLSIEVRGLRHHWFALDWLSPANTFKQHIQAGYHYDSSLAWRGGPGFRAATSFPFQPFDPDLDKPLPIYELPTCLMDGHILSHHGDLETAVIKGEETLHMVKRFGGVAVLNWHTESICNQWFWKNSFTLLQCLLDPCISAGDVWFATPMEIVDHWDERARRLAHY